MTEGFTTRDYWERRLRDHFSLEGVGYLRLGRRFNEWMYRIRGEVFDRVVGEIGGGRADGRTGGPAEGRTGGRADGVQARGWAGARVLEVGPGTGFYVDRWVRLGAEVTGVDITQVVVEQLATRFPTGRFLQADIGEPLAAPLAGETGTFDVVSAFDVLFHIVDDAKYDRALGNLARLLRPGGLFLWSDNFVHRPTVRVTHQVSRSLAEITAALDRAGFAVLRRVPMFVLMNYPADTTSRLARWAWTALVAPATVSDWVGGVLGRALYPIERRLVRSRGESPSTELMVCRRR